MLAIFDNDGTICDTQNVEGDCFAAAIKNVLGISLATLDWTHYPEPTSSAIVRELLSGDDKVLVKEEKIKQEFLRLLKEEQPKFPNDFTPLSGAVEFINQLKEGKIFSVAIATGGFDSEAAFKLQCCGIVLDDFPHATSSDTPRRKDIIALAAERAGSDISAAVYFGDSPWDVHVSRSLAIPMIGIGRRIGELKALGVQHTFRDYSDVNAILQALDNIKRAKV